MTNIPENGAYKRIKRVLFVYPEAYPGSGGGITTYICHAIKAHIAAGRKVHLLTWLTPTEPMYFRDISLSDLYPAAIDGVTVVRLTGEEIVSINPVGSRQKNASDLLFQHIADVEAGFRPDLIESTDYLFPLHTYLERRRAGLHHSTVPVAIFNHGLLHDIYPASAVFPSDLAARELACELQVLRWADFVLAPSEAAQRRIIELRRTADGVCLVREPFEPHRWTTHEQLDPGKFLYFGRVSFAKGVDIFAGMLTAVHGEWPISHIAFVGRHEVMPFRKSDSRDFISQRLHPELRGKTMFLDAVQPAEVQSTLASYSFFGNFSRSETFSYTTLEALSAGVVPLMLTDSPMAEFLPEDVRKAGTFDEPPHRAEVIRRVLVYWTSNYFHALAETQRHAAALTDPSVYAAHYDRLVRTFEPKSGCAVSKRYSGQDVSILVCTHNDATLLREAVVSVFKQTERVREIVVLDDGSTDPKNIEFLDDMARDRLIRLIRVKNMGLVAGRNVLVENANTELVIFLDADDLLHPRYVERTLQAMNTGAARWSAVITRRKNFGMNSHEMQSFLLDTPMHWLFNDFRMTALIRREVLQEIRFNATMRNGEADDWWWWLRFTARGHSANFVPEPLFLYRAVPGSMSVPWSHGQAALTAELLKDVATAASKQSVDLLPALQMALFASYKYAWEKTEMQNRLHVSGSPHLRVAAFDQISSLLIRIIGRDRAGTMVAIARRAAHSHPFIRRVAVSALALIGRITRPAS